MNKKNNKKVSKSKLASAILAYFNSAKDELYRVTWPTKRQATASALIVLSVTLLAAVFFGVADFLISEGYMKFSEFAKNVKTS